MKRKTPSFLSLMILAFGLMVCLPFVSSEASGLFAQNRISGFIFGLNRQPLDGMNVELLNDRLSAVGRTRTTGSGRYTFETYAEGVLTVRVYTSGTDYEEQEKSVEIQNVSISTSGGGTKRSGFANEQLDFYMRLKSGVIPANVVVFAQDVPAEAKKLYEKAVSDLDSKRTNEALAELRQAIEIFPKYYMALELLGTEYVKLRRPEAYMAAEMLLTAAVAENPRAFKSWYNLAHARYELSKFADALTSVQKAVELNSNSPEAVFLYGVLLMKAKKFPEAEKQLIKARDLSKDKIPSVHFELAMLYANEMKRFADAAKELKTFLKAQPDYKDAENMKKLIAQFEAKASSK